MSPNKANRVERLRRDDAADGLRFPRRAGVSAIYGPGTNIPKVAAEILSLIQKHRLAA
jgi:methylmalonyl-CoA mutase cobalamin-binding subunit